MKPILYSLLIAAMLCSPAWAQKHGGGGGGDGGDSDDAPQSAVGDAADQALKPIKDVNDKVSDTVDSIKDTIQKIKGGADSSDAGDSDSGATDTSSDSGNSGSTQNTSGNNSTPAGNGASGSWGDNKSQPVPGGVQGGNVAAGGVPSGANRAADDGQGAPGGAGKDAAGHGSDSARNGESDGGAHHKTMHGHDYIANGMHKPHQRFASANGMHRAGGEQPGFFGRLGNSMKNGWSAAGQKLHSFGNQPRNPAPWAQKASIQHQRATGNVTKKLASESR